jgi:sec-independent protein translocase protein TatB
MNTPADRLKNQYSMHHANCRLTLVATLSMMHKGHLYGSWNHLSSTMLSVPHMIVVFLVVLVVFGPQKLPELARSFGKLMAEFRNASNDFKSAFEEEMRDLERQARIADLKKQVAEANGAADAAVRNAANPALPAPSPATTPLAQAAANSHSGDFPVVQPVPEAIPRLDGGNPETEAPASEAAKAEPAADAPPSHDQQ